MIIGRVLSPVHSLGPGNRVCLWTQGCSKQCEGCISPELQDPRGIDVSESRLAELLIRIAQKNECQGLTVSGGDPFEQADALLKLLKLVRKQFDDILVYTGFQLNEIVCGNAGEAGRACLQYIDVLIDGRYVRSLNTPECVMRGSGNQTIVYLNDSIRTRYEEYMKKGRVIETFVHDNQTIITGILDEVRE